MKELKRITYVDDEPDIRTIVQIALEKLGGFTLNVCESGSEAVEQATKFDPDMVLLDVMMPDMDGMETYRSLRAKPNMDDVPVVFLTAKGQTHEVDRYKALGAADVIVKPFDPLTLSERVQAIWEQSQAGK